MSTFRFDIGNVRVTGYISSAKSSEGEAFRVVGVCPVCNKEMKAGYEMGKIYTKAEVSSTFKKNVKKHITKMHGK